VTPIDKRAVLNADCAADERSSFVTRDAYVDRVAITKSSAPVIHTELRLHDGRTRQYLAVFLLITVRPSPARSGTLLAAPLRQQKELKP
jgi:hypothetical protein